LGLRTPIGDGLWLFHHAAQQNISNMKPTLHLTLLQSDLRCPLQRPNLVPARFTSAYTSSDSHGTTLLRFAVSVQMAKPISRDPDNHRTTGYGVRPPIVGWTRWSGTSAAGLRK
jgi:hypothetical protein